MSWQYDVRDEGQDIIFSFSTPPNQRRIRHHTSPQYAPYADLDISIGNEIRVTPGQWLEGLINGQWSGLSDADNR